MSLPRNRLPVAAVGLYAALAGLAEHFGGDSLPSFCIFRLTTGVPCPGCGSTRAGLALLSGHFAEALQQNPLAACLLAVAALGAGAWLVARALGREWRPLRCVGVTPSALEGRPRPRARARTLALVALGLAVGLNWAYLITRSPSRIGTRPPVWAALYRNH